MVNNGVLIRAVAVMQPLFIVRQARLFSIG